MPDAPPRTIQARARLVAVAQRRAPADLVIRGARVFSAFTRDWVQGDVAIAEGRFAGVGGPYDGPVLDAGGRHVVPGFIDAHVHVESAKLTVGEFGRVVCARGTSAVVADPHEIANALGVEGVLWLLEQAGRAPIDALFMVPSCVPASPLESPRAPFAPSDIARLLEHPRMLGVAEAMNFPGVLAGEDAELAKLALSDRVDGHAPGLLGAALDAYLAAGIRTDHECTTPEEAEERLRRGAWVLLREGSAARNLRDLLGVVRRYGPDRMAFCTDDREPDTLLHEGHLDHLCRVAVQEGVSAEDALVLASLNGARCHGLAWRGAIAPGWLADCALLDDLEGFRASLVLKDGEVVARDGRAVSPHEDVALPAWVGRSVRVAPIADEQLRIPGGDGPLRAVGVVRGQILTTEEHVAPGEDGVARLAAIERHHATGRVGLGLLAGFGLRAGAVATTVSHDAHNIIAAFADEHDVRAAVARLQELGGGIVVCHGGTVTAELALPVGGLLSTRPAEEVAAGLEHVREALRDLGVDDPEPVTTLSFLSLSVIPELRVTDLGLVRVTDAALVPLSVSG